MRQFSNDLFCDNDATYFSGTIQPEYSGSEAINPNMKLTDTHRISLFEQTRKREV